MKTMQLVSEYLAACQANGASSSTIAAKQSVLGRFVQDNPELPLQPEPIFQFLATVGKTVGSRNVGRKHIRAFYTFACQNYDLTDPMPQVSVPLRAAKGARPRQRSSAQVMHMGGGGTATATRDQAITCPDCGAPIYFRGDHQFPIEQKGPVEGRDL